MAQVNDDLVSNEVRNYIEKLTEELSIKNYYIDISAGSIRGDNYLGIIAKVLIKGETKSGKKTTLNFIVKSAPRNEVFRSLAPIRSAYDREIYIYSKVFPEFAKLQEERGILKPFQSFAKFYKGILDDKNEALIMENMKELGFELFDRHQTLNYSHVLLAMKEYGKFHALSYALRDQKPDLFKELSNNTQESFFSNLENSEAFEQTIYEQSDRALKTLDPIKEKVIYDKFKHFQERMFEIVKEVVGSKPAGQYAVIGHGDSWMNNMLFKYGNSSSRQSPSQICFLDWQLSRLASPALDLAYFIFVCTDKDLRDQHYEHLIQEYYDSLSSFLRELGSDPDKLFPFEVLQEHLKKFCVYGLYMAVMVLYLITSDVEDIPDIHSITDEDDAMEKWKFESRNIEKFNSRIRGVILDFIKYGYEF